METSAFDSPAHLRKVLDRYKRDLEMVKAGHPPSSLIMTFWTKDLPPDECVAFIEGRIASVVLRLLKHGDGNA